MKPPRIPILTPIECPNCRDGIPRYRLFMRSAWSRWRCRSCGSLLGIDTRRRLLCQIPWIAIMLLLLFVVRVSTVGWLIGIPVLVGAAVLFFFMIDRVVLLERTGFRCRRCGYDLHDQTAGRCPECGLEFDRRTDEVPASGPRPGAQRWGRNVIALVLVVALVIMLIASVLLVRSYRTQPSSPPQTSPGNTRPTSSPG